MLRGEGETSAKYLVHNISAAPKGKTIVTVRFVIDPDGELSVTAFEYQTNRELQVSLR